jgi:hypothetical protein
MGTGLLELSSFFDAIVYDARRVFENPSLDALPPSGGVLIFGERASDLREAFLRDSYFAIQHVPVSITSLPSELCGTYYTIHLDSLLSQRTF